MIEMADDTKREIKEDDKNWESFINESDLKQTIDSVSLDGIDSLETQTETKKTKKSKRNTTSSLSGIDDITSYIQQRKNKSETMNPELLTARDGIDLRSQEGVYAVVPHRKNDHKLVYMRKDAPKDLIVDPKGRRKWSEYKKNGMKIYDVHLDYAEHPALKSADGKPLDVWIIDSPEDLDRQLQAIRDGKWWWTNFMSPVLNEKNKEGKEDDKEDSTKKEEEKRKKEEAQKKKDKEEKIKEEKTLEEEEKQKTKKAEESKRFQDEEEERLQEDRVLEEQEKMKEESALETEKEKQDKEDKQQTEVNELEEKELEQKALNAKSEANRKKELSLDDILPLVNEDASEETEATDEESTIESKYTNTLSELTLDDILPIQSTEEELLSDKKEKNNPTAIEETATKDTDSKKELSLDDILPPLDTNTSETEIEESKEVSEKEIQTQETLDQEDQQDDTQKQLEETPDENTEPEVIVVEDEFTPPISTDADPEETQLIHADEPKNKDTTQEETIDKSNDSVEESMDVPQSTDKTWEKQDDGNIEDQVEEEEISTQIPEPSEEVEESKDQTEESIKLTPIPKAVIEEEIEELPEIELPPLEEFTPKEFLQQPSETTESSTSTAAQTRSSTSTTQEEKIEKQPETVATTPTTERATDFAPDELTQDDAPQQDSNTDTSAVINSQEDTEIPGIVSPAEEVTVNEILQDAPQEEEPVSDKQDSFIDLDSMTFEPVQQATTPQPTTVHNDGVIGNENTEPKTNHKAKLVLLMIKSFIAIILIWLAIWIVTIMFGGSGQSTPTDTSPSQTGQVAEQPTPTEQPDTDTTVPDTGQLVEQPTPTEPEIPVVDTPTPPIVQQFTIPQLTAKIQAQQIEARRLLNKAKLLNDREGIKFATAALLKSSKLLDEAEESETITASMLESQSQTIDLYLGQAQAVVE